MPGKAHIDPGVAAAVEAGQQHGDNEGHGCVWGERKVTKMKDLCQVWTERQLVYSVKFCILANKMLLTG